MVRRLTFLIVLTGLIGLGQPAAASNEPVRLTFGKVAASPGIWQGTVAGDIEGSLTTVLLDLREAGPVWHVRFDWIIEAGPSSLTARLDGVLNMNTGAVVMDGTVVEGDLLGARIHEEGQLVDAASLRFTGSITILPANRG